MHENIDIQSNLKKKFRKFLRGIKATKIANLIQIFRISTSQKARKQANLATKMS